MGGTVTGGGGSPWVARQPVTIEKDLDKVGSDQQYTVQGGDTCWNLALALKANNSDLKTDTKTLAEQLEKQAKISQGKDLKTGTVLDLSDYTKKSSDGTDRAAFSFPDKPMTQDEIKKQYIPNAVKYMRQFDKDNNNNFSAQELTNAFHLTKNDDPNDLMQTLDVNGDGNVDLKEATTGLMMEDQMNNNDLGTLPDGQVSVDEQNAFLKAFKDGVSQGPTGIQANQSTLNGIATASDYLSNQFTNELNKAYTK